MFFLKVHWLIYLKGPGLLKCGGCISICILMLTKESIIQKKKKKLKIQNRLSLMQFLDLHDYSWLDFNHSNDYIHIGNLKTSTANPNLDFILLLHCPTVLSDITVYLPNSGWDPNTAILFNTNVTQVKKQKQSDDMFVYQSNVRIWKKGKLAKRFIR